jgi:hypothetical protein
VVQAVEPLAFDPTPGNERLDEERLANQRSRIQKRRSVLEKRLAGQR